ncbi:MAG: YqgE/AlgH family protein [Thermodesulfobacteriota bacterium]
MAGDNLKGSVFSGSIIFLIDYGWHGAMGLVINRPTKVELSMALPDLKGLKGRPDKVYWGGPVETNRVTVLFRSERRVEGADHVFRDIYVSSNLEVLERIVAGGKGTGVFRVYGGYAGWAPRQLEGEITRGGWRVMGGDEAAVFDAPPTDKRPGVKPSP